MWSIKHDSEFLIIAVNSFKILNISASFQTQFKKSPYIHSQSFRLILYVYKVAH